MLASIRQYFYLILHLYGFMELEIEEIWVEIITEKHTDRLNQGIIHLGNQI